MLSGNLSAGKFDVSRIPYISIFQKVCQKQASTDMKISWSRRTLEKASERVVDVQGDDDDFEEAPLS